MGHYLNWPKEDAPTYLRRAIQKYLSAAWIPIGPGITNSEPFVRCPALLVDECLLTSIGMGCRASANPVRAVPLAQRRLQEGGLEGRSR